MRPKLYSRINHDKSGSGASVETNSTNSKVQGNRLRKKQLRFESLSITFVSTVQGCEGHCEESGGVFASIY